MTALDEAGGGHLEEAELAGRPEAVLHGPREAEPVVPVALEGEDGVDQVLQGARPGRVALFRDVPDDHDGRPRGAGGLTQLLDHGPDLRQAPRRPRRSRRTQGLDRVEDHQRGPMLLDGGERVVEIGGREDEQGGRHGAEASSPGAHGGGGLLGGDEQRGRTQQRRTEQHLERQRRLADARLAVEEGERPGRQAAREDTVELTDAGRAR